MNPTVAPIILSSQESAGNSDILQGTRLQTVPAGGFLTLELQASDNDATNHYTVSIQMPGGNSPMQDVRIPCGHTSGLAGVIDERENLTATFPIMQGGHCVFSCTETGSAELSWRITYSPV